MYSMSFGKIKTKSQKKGSQMSMDFLCSRLDIQVSSKLLLENQVTYPYRRQLTSQMGSYIEIKISLSLFQW